MKYRIIILLAFLLCVQILKINAQQKALDSASRFEQGDISEIKNKRRVFIVAYKPYQGENIAKILKKYQSIQIVDNIDMAEFIIVFDVERRASQTFPGVFGAPPPTEDAQYFGYLLVYLPSKTAKNRIMWDARARYLDSPRISVARQELMWEEAIEKSLSSKFIKELKKIRGEK